MYYEADCFAYCKNPYIPLDLAEPSSADVFQKPLVGDGMEERREVCKETQEEFSKVFAGKDHYDREVGRRFSDLLCGDVSNERKRIGGDWVIAGVATMTHTRESRDMMRYSVHSFCPDH